MIRTRIYEDLVCYYQLWRDTCLGCPVSQELEIVYLTRLLASQVPQIKTIFDMGGGIGVHAIPLLRSGFDVTVYDQSVYARSIATKLEPRLKYIVGSFEHVAVPQRFDAMISMWSSMSYILSRPAIIDFCEWLTKSVQRMIVIDQPNFNIYPARYRRLYNGEDSTHRMTIDRRWTMRGRRKHTRFVYRIQNKRTGHVDEILDQEVQQYVSVAELKQLLGPTWHLDSIHGDYMQTSFQDEISTRMISVFLRVA